MKKVRSFYALGALVFAAATIALSGGSASAWANDNQNQENSKSSSNSAACPADSSAAIDIALDTVVKGDDGSQHQLTTKQVDNGDYSVQVVAENQDSTHPNSNITVSSGDSKVMVNDVESKASQNKTADGTLHVTDGKVAVSVQLGRDGIFSGGAKVSLSQCKPATPPAPTKTLPNTGPSTLLISAAAVTGIAGYGASLLYMRRKARA